MLKVEQRIDGGQLRMRDEVRCTAVARQPEKTQNFASHLPLLHCLSLTYLLTEYCCATVHCC
jgi:hypothetical protein